MCNNWQLIFHYRRVRPRLRFERCSAPDHGIVLSYTGIKYSQRLLFRKRFSADLSNSSAHSSHRYTTPLGISVVLLVRISSHRRHAIPFTILSLLDHPSLKFPNIPLCFGLFLASRCLLGKSHGALDPISRSSHILLSCYNFSCILDQHPIGILFTLLKLSVNLNSELRTFFTLFWLSLNRTYWLNLILFLIVAAWACFAAYERKDGSSWAWR